ncbi:MULTISPECIES: hypothetical protein [Pseudomonas]|uniref:hypothetical protein n=1 Tax=Pseudomonas TaxID=286 RepID=UPI000BB633C4|nr:MULTISPECIES: hypothetical protein [Pseudomonas]
MPGDDFVGNAEPVWELAVVQLTTAFEQALMAFCRSELAREELTGAAFILDAHVIVDVFREQARSYRGLVPGADSVGNAWPMCAGLPAIAVVQLKIQ